MSWFWRGFQSAIFYYVSCAPCIKLSYQRKGRKAKKRALAETAALENTTPEGYHASPFSTNIYWREEMSLGPGPPPRKGDRNKGRASSSRELTTAGKGSSAGGSSANTTLVVESLDGQELEQEILSPDGWNRKRYQRPDELLWGIDVEVEADGRPAMGMGLSMAMTSRSTSTNNSSSYFTARNPAVNDLHPPVVSTQPTRKCETQWMLQPPPSAKIMEGKARESRDRGVSDTSRGSSRQGHGQGRVAKRPPTNEKPIPAQARPRSQTPTEAAPLSPKTPEPKPKPNPKPKPEDRHRHSRPSNPSPSPSPSTSTSSSPSSLDSPLHPTTHSGPPTRHPKPAPRPALPTIDSSATSSATLTRPQNLQPTSPARPISISISIASPLPLAALDASAHKPSVLRELVVPASVLNRGASTVRLGGGTEGKGFEVERERDGEREGERLVERGIEQDRERERGMDLQFRFPRVA